MYIKKTRSREMQADGEGLRTGDAAAKGRETLRKIEQSHYYNNTSPRICAQALIV